MAKIRIISGGQTGADQAALYAAKVLGIAYGGWCPKGRLTELGKKIPPDFTNLKEVPFEAKDLDQPENFAMRTKMNIEDSNATMIFVPSWPLPSSITDGTLLTIEYAKLKNKKYLLVDLSNPESEKKIAAFFQELKPEPGNEYVTINIAGPRESQLPGVQQKVYNLLLQTLMPFSAKSQNNSSNITSSSTTFKSGKQDDSLIKMGVNIGTKPIALISHL